MTHTLIRIHDDSALDAAQAPGQEDGRSNGAVIGGVATLAAVPLGWMAYSALMVDHQVALPPPVDAERRVVRGARGGLLACYADEGGTGEAPLLLVHSVNAAASAYEIRPLFDRFRGRRPVYAVDLPGFGFSERTDRDYTPALYAAAIEECAAALFGDEACDVVALSLAGEFAAMAAVSAPARFRSLTLISPTGFALPSQRRSVQRRSAQGGSARAHRLLKSRPIAQPLFDLLVTRPSIRFFLNQSFEGRADEAMVDYAYRTAHQPGARFAPLTFLSGRLFTPDVRERVYTAVATPTLVLHDDAPYGGFGALPEFVARRPNWQAVRVGPTRGLPQFERLEETAALLEEFWGGVVAER